MKKILLEKTPSEIAKEHGLIYGGFGGWVEPKTREVKARTIDGKFVPVPKEPGSNAKENLGKVIIFDFDPLLLKPDKDAQGVAQKHSKVLKASVKAGVPVFVLTPQGTENNVAKFLGSIGVRKGAKLVAMDASDPQKKAEFVEEKINAGYKHVIFFDDEETNNHAVEALNAKFNRLDVQVDTHLLPRVSKNQEKSLEEPIASAPAPQPKTEEGFGFKMPSITKKFAAATSVKRMFRAAGGKAPPGGGMITNPKKALYNKIYRASKLNK